MKCDPFKKIHHFFFCLELSALFEKKAFSLATNILSKKFNPSATNNPSTKSKLIIGRKYCCLKPSVISFVLEIVEYHTVWLLFFTWDDHYLGWSRQQAPRLGQVPYPKTHTHPTHHSNGDKWSLFGGYIIGIRPPSLLFSLTDNNNRRWR